MEQIIASPAQAVPTDELRALVNAAPAREGRSRSEDVFLNGMQVGSISLTKTATEQKEAYHYAHPHESGFGKLEQKYFCLVCQKEVPYAERARVKAEGKQGDSNLFENASLKPEDTGAEGGLAIQADYNGQIRTDQVKESFFVAAKRFKLKKEKPKDTANINAIWTVVKRTCQSPLLCRYKGRRAVWQGESLFVLWNESELNGVPKGAFPNATENPGIKQALTMLRVGAAEAVSIATV